MLDKTGNPLVGVRVFASSGTSNTPAEWQYASEPAAQIAAADRNAIRVFAPSELEPRLMLTTLVSRWVRSDKDGRFVLPMPPEAMPDLLLQVLDDPSRDVGHAPRQVRAAHAPRTEGKCCGRPPSRRRARAP